MKDIKQCNGGLVLYFEMIIMVEAWSKRGDRGKVKAITGV